MRSDKEKRLKVISTMCKNLRLKYGIDRKQMSIISGYSISNIQHFEDGCNNNALILLDYMKMLDVEEILDIIWGEL